MRRKWLVGLGVVTLVGCAVGTGGDGPSTSTPAEPSEPSTPATQGSIVGGATVEQLQALLDRNGRTHNATSYLIHGDVTTPELRVQMYQRELALRAKTPPSTTDWNVTTGAPVRSSPATYGDAWLTNSVNDMIAFSTDSSTLAGGQVSGITGGISNMPTGTTLTNMQASTLFVMDNLYGSQPRLIYYNNQASEVYGLSGTIFSFNKSDIRLFAITAGGQLHCYLTPEGPSGAVPAVMSPCGNWAAAGFHPGGNMTWSSPFPVYNPVTADVSRIYFGDDTGKLHCVDTSQASGPANCTGYPVQLGGGTTKMAPPTVVPISTTNYIIFIGGENGVFYQVSENAGVVAHNSSTLGTGTANRIHTAATLNLSGSGNNRAYVTAGGKLYEFPATYTQGSFAPTFTLTLFSGATQPTDASPAIDLTQSTNSIYVATNGNLYKTQFPFSASSAVTSTKLFQAASANVIVDGTTVNAASFPIGFPLPYYNSLFVATGAGGRQTAGATGIIEQYGCTGSTSAPVFTESTNGGPYGVAIETSMVLDFATGNLNFGYDNGNTAGGGSTSGSGGLVQYPANATVPDTANGWACPSPYVFDATIACGSGGCKLPAGSCFSDADCSGSTPRCYTATHTCVACLANTDCSGSTPACDLTNDTKFHTCVACTANSNCSGSTPRCETSAASPSSTTYQYTCVACNGTGQNACAAGFKCDRNTGEFFDECIANTRNNGTQNDCTTDTQCNNSATTPHCDAVTGSPLKGYCVACTADAQCSAGTVCVANTTSLANDPKYDTCQQCDAINTTNCTGGATCNQTVGDTNYDKCVSCSPPDSTSGNGCPDPKQPICSSTSTCEQCRTNADCPSGFCDSSGSHYCICFTPGSGTGCPDSAICSSGNLCTN